MVIPESDVHFGLAVTTKRIKEKYKQLIVAHNWTFAMGERVKESKYLPSFCSGRSA
jgi:hypothetical protein